MRSTQSVSARTATALAAGLVLAMPSGLARAGGPPWPLPSGYLWERPKIHGYHEPESQPPPPAQPPPATPQKYIVQITVLPTRPPEADPNIAHVVAHVPDNALIWFDGQPTKQTGTMRYYESPPLVPGKRYHYTARVAWVENGHWVSQTDTFPAHAGDVHCVYLVRSDSPGLEDVIKTNLAKLSPEDRKLAAEQKFCAVQEGVRLGSMGVPVKIMLKGRPVFLCCKGCTEVARESPDRTLGEVKELRSRAVPRKSE
jgi:uncharacterized protein (TIGR03000 family)